MKIKEFEAGRIGYYVAALVTKPSGAHQVASELSQMQCARFHLCILSLTGTHSPYSYTGNSAYEAGSTNPTLIESPLTARRAHRVQGT